MILTIRSHKYGIVNALIDDDDYEKLKDWSFYVWGTSRHYGLYLMGYSPNNKKQSQRIHRVILNAQKNQLVDHINQNTLDNRKQNLRICDATLNNQNARKRKDGVTSKYKGVHFCKQSKKWKAQIQRCGKKLSLGTFLVEKDAALAYNKFVVENNIQSPLNVIKE